jgi:hypothetical protein
MLVKDRVGWVRMKNTYLRKYVRSQAQAKQKKMCVWDYKGEGPRLSSINKGHRSKP